MNRLNWDKWTSKIAELITAQGLWGLVNGAGNEGEPGSNDDRHYDSVLRGIISVQTDEVGVYSDPEDGRTPHDRVDWDLFELLEKLDATNYIEWKVRMMAFLRAADLWQVVEGSDKRPEEPPVPDFGEETRGEVEGEVGEQKHGSAFEERSKGVKEWIGKHWRWYSRAMVWDDRAQLAGAIITLAIGESQLPYLSTDAPPLEIWWKILAEHEGPRQKAQKLAQYMALREDDFESVEDYIDERRRIDYHLHVMGVTCFDEKHHALMLIGGLRKWRATSVLAELDLDGDLTWKKVIPLILENDRFEKMLIAMEANSVSTSGSGQRRPRRQGRS